MTDMRELERVLIAAQIACGYVYPMIRRRILPPPYSQLRLEARHALN